MISPIVKFKSFWSEVPREVQKFLIRVLVIFLVWKLAYHLVLKPTRVIDKPLTIIVAKHTVDVLKIIYPNNTFSYIKNTPTNKIDFFSVSIFKNARKIVGIADPCNALELMVLYVGFFLAMPVSFKRTAVFTIIGLLIIYVCNIIRCSFLSYLNIERSLGIEIAHHYIFKLIMYLMIFGGWMWCLKNKEVANG